MKTQTINPQIGGYFKHEDRVYRAIHSQDFSCHGCCFMERLEMGTHYCNSPVSVDCSGKVIKDVTGMLDAFEVELVDEPAKKINVWPVLILACIAFWTLIILILT